MQGRSQESACMGAGQWKEYRRCFWVGERSQCWFHGCVQLWQVIKGHPYNLYTCLSGCSVGEGRKERERDRRRRISYFSSIQNTLGASLVVQWLRLCAASAGGPGSIPGPGTRCHMQQLRVCMPQLKKAHMQQEARRSPTQQLTPGAAK